MALPLLKDKDLASIQQQLTESKVTKMNMKLHLPQRADKSSTALNKHQFTQALNEL